MKFEPIILCILCITLSSLTGCRGSGNSSSQENTTTGDDFVSEIASFATADTTDCGHVEIDENRTEINNCVSNAFVAGDSFFAIYDLQEADSLVLKVIVSDPNSGINIHSFNNGIVESHKCEIPVQQQTTDKDSQLPIACIEGESKSLQTVILALENSQSFVLNIGSSSPSMENNFEAEHHAIALNDEKAALLIYDNELEANEMAHRITPDGYNIEKELDDGSHMTIHNDWWPAPHFFLKKTQLLYFLALI